MKLLVSFIFFHAKVNARQSNNWIKSILNNVGQRVFPKQDIAAVVHNYFEDIFQASNVDELALASTLDCIPAMVTDEPNQALTKSFTVTDVDAALKSMGSNKSPSIDGMSAMFYQQNWSTVRDIFSKVVLSILNDGADPTILNRTIITLIPKIKKPQQMKDFRPISLCNIISKLVSPKC
uniref:Uncharacterized protein n=1 Tax=Cannabis sativa TaxID=3483 RepID=A0A803P6P3_CANSA